jgi:hypothetical protein
MSFVRTDELSANRRSEHDVLAPNSSGDHWRPSSVRWGKRWFVVGLLLCLLFSMGHWAGAFQKEQEILRAKAVSAERFEVRGDDKKLRASLSRSADGGADLSFYDESGNPRLTMGIGATGSPTISFFDDKNAQIMALGLDPSDGMPGIHLYDDLKVPVFSLGIGKASGPDILIGKKGQGRISMSVSEGRSSSIQISDSKDNTRLALNVVDNESMILLLGENKAVRASWRVHADGVVSFSLRDTQGRDRLLIMTDKDGKPSIRFFDADRNVVKEL